MAVDETEPPAPKEPHVDIKQEDEDTLHVSAKGQGIVRNLDELYDVAEISPADWAADDFQARTWATPLRQRVEDGTGKVKDKIVVVRSWYISAKFRRRLDINVTYPEWKAPAPMVRKPSSLVPSAIILPDWQTGYRWQNKHRKLLPLHDWNALDAALQLTAMLNPTIVQMLGDNIDLAPFSTKYDLSNDLRDTTIPSILTVHSLLRRLMAVAPHAEVDWQGGNHDDRGQRAVRGRGTGLEEMDNLTTADNPNGAPVLSFAHLVGLEKLGISWRPYHEERWLWNAVRIHHGELVRSGGGKTVAKALQDATHSQLFGHIHRREIAAKTIWGPKGRHEIYAASPGCLCDVSGNVPGVSAHPDWQQGIGIVWWDEARGQEHIEIVPIHNGVLVWKGERIVGDGARLSEEIAEEIGWPQIQWAPS